MQPAGNGERPLSWRYGLVPAGGAIAAACFFLPWGRFSFLMVYHQASGRSVGGSAWSVFAIAVIVMAGGVFLAHPRRPAWVRTAVLGAAFLGLLLFVMEASGLAHGIWTPLGHLRPQDVGVTPSAGSLGTTLGFLLAIVGVFVVPEPWPRLGLPSSSGPDDGADRGTREAP